MRKEAVHWPRQIFAGLPFHHLCLFHLGWLLYHCLSQGHVLGENCGACPGQILARCCSSTCIQCDCRSCPWHRMSYIPRVGNWLYLFLLPSPSRSLSQPRERKVLHGRHQQQRRVYDAEQAPQAHERLWLKRNRGWDLMLNARDVRHTPPVRVCVCVLHVD